MTPIYPLFFLRVVQNGTPFLGFVDSGNYGVLRQCLEGGVPFTLTLSAQTGVDVFIGSPPSGGLAVSIHAAVAKDGTTVYRPVFHAPNQPEAVSPEPFEGAVQANPGNYPHLIATVKVAPFARKMFEEMGVKLPAEVAGPGEAPKPAAEDVPK